MRVKVKERERVRVTYTKRKSVGPENFERVTTLEFAMVFGKLDNFEYLRDRIKRCFERLAYSLEIFLEISKPNGAGCV